jgi:Glycerophosphoryl diester phosphodiesterase family
VDKNKNGKNQESTEISDLIKERTVGFGHRGALYEAVENTLESFQRCIDMRCDGIELDVFRLKDGSLVVFHGGGTDKNPGLLESYCIIDDTDNDGTTILVTTDGGGDTKQVKTILDMSYSETQELKFDRDSQHLPASVEQFESAKIPTLQEVLQLMQGTKLQIKLELKGAGTVEPALRCVQELDICRTSCFPAFSTAGSVASRNCTAGTRTPITAAIFPAHVPDNFADISRAVQADEIHLRYDTCSRDRIQAAHRAGFRTMAWFRGPKALKDDILR